jgi:hypothetical protein
LRSFKDIVTDTILNVEAGEETIQLELEEKEKALDIVLDKGEAVAFAFHILEKSLDSIKDIDTLATMLKERIVA